MASKSHTILYRPVGTVLKLADSAKANVLRECSAETFTNLVTAQYSFTGGANYPRQAAIDGSGWNDEGSLPAGGTTTVTFTLAGLRTVGSYMVQFETAPTRYVIEGTADGKTWTTLADLVPASTASRSDCPGSRRSAPNRFIGLRLADIRRMLR